jgi:hypothetical protein
MMESVDRNEAKQEKAEVSVNFHAPCEKIFTNGDYIEVNIHFNDGVQRDGADIQELIAGAMEGVSSARHSGK